MFRIEKKKNKCIKLKSPKEKRATFDIAIVGAVKISHESQKYVRKACLQHNGYLYFIICLWGWSGTTFTIIVAIHWFIVPALDDRW
jgi:hypothetical protein